MKTTYTMWGKAIYSKNYKKLMNFVKTDKGKEFVSKLHTGKLKDIAMRYSCPFVLFFKNDTKNYKLIQKACKDSGIIVETTTIKSNVIDYTHVSIPKQLTKTEIKSIESHRPKSKMGHAERHHRLENHKMDKWDKHHPRPTEEQLKGDLFPSTLYEGWKALRSNHQERIHNQIVMKYYKDYVPIYGRITKIPFGYAEKIIGFVKDTKNEITKINDFMGDVETSPKQLVKRAQCILDEAIKNDNRITSARILSRCGNYGRILIPNNTSPNLSISAIITRRYNTYIAA